MATAALGSHEQPGSDFYEFTGTKLQEFPLPAALPLQWGRRLDSLAQRLAASSPAAVCASGTPSRAALDAATCRVPAHSAPR